MGTLVQSAAAPSGSRGVALALALLAIAACARTPPPVAPPPPSAAAASEEAVGAPAHAIARSALRAALAQGLGSFLQRVDVDDKPVIVAGKFHGFRIAALRGDSFWGGVDLKPGDVVTRVNGLPIERPEQALAAFDSLATASELRVSYERDGEPRDLVYPIVDDAQR